MSLRVLSAPLPVRVPRSARAPRPAWRPALQLHSGRYVSFSRHCVTHVFLPTTALPRGTRISETPSNRGHTRGAGCEEYGGVAATRATHTPCSPSLCRLSAAASPGLLSRAPSKHRNRSCSSAARREPPPPRPRLTSGTAIATPPRVPIVLALTGRGQKSSGSTALEAKSKGQA